MRGHKNNNGFDDIIRKQCLKNKRSAYFQHLIKMKEKVVNVQLSEQKYFSNLYIHAYYK